MKKAYGYLRALDYKWIVPLREDDEFQEKRRNEQKREFNSDKKRTEFLWERDAAKCNR